MKLLSEKEIAQKKNADRSKEIAEGLKLSRRVDSLRELQSKESEALEKFREESLAAIGEEIKKANEEREVILGQLQNIRAEKEKGLGEVVEREKKVSLREKEVDKLLKSLKVKEENLKNEIELAHKGRIEVEANLKLAELEKEYAEKDHAKVVGLKEDAEYESKKAKKTRQEAQELKKKVEKELDSREDEVEKQEKVIASELKEIKKEKEDINKQKIQIADQREVLRAAFEELRSRQNK